MSTVPTSIPDGPRAGMTIVAAMTTIPAPRCSNSGCPPECMRPAGRPGGSGLHEALPEGASSCVQAALHSLTLPALGHQPEEQHDGKHRQDAGDAGGYPEVLQLLPVANIALRIAAQGPEQQAARAGGHADAEVVATDDQGEHRGLHVLRAEAGEERHLRHPLPLRDHRPHDGATEDEEVVRQAQAEVGAREEEDVTEVEQRERDVGRDQQAPVADLR
mmetsp:Transcript_63484/g.127333  ORF Transcript_63484/g.127333 Transcript_63484/m.127333 type:complete len:218 (-) Transcript_63484:777-1430(-)